MYIIKKLYCHFEHDHFEDGCIGDGEFKVVEISFQNESMKGLIGEVSEFIGSDSFEVDPCDSGEINRIDWQVMENENGYKASEYDKEQWKNGEKVLYLCTYTAEVYKLESVDLNVIFGNEE